MYKIYVYLLVYIDWFFYFENTWYMTKPTLTAFWIFLIYVFTLKLKMKKCKSSFTIVTKSIYPIHIPFSIIFKNSSVVSFAITFWNTIGWNLSIRYHWRTNSKVISIDTWFVFKSNWKLSLLIWNWNIVKFMAKKTFVWKTFTMEYN